MRVLSVIDSLAPGGAETSLAALAPHMIAGGLELEVAFLVERDGLRDHLEDAGARVLSLAGPGGRTARAWRAAALIGQRRPDLVHTTLFEAALAGRTAGRARDVPVVSSLTGIPYGDSHRSDPGVIQWKMRGAQLCDAITARLVARFHAVGDHVADVMSHRLRIPRGRIEVIPRGRDPERLGTRSPARRARARATLDLGDAPTILAAARHEHAKGLDLLLEAMAAILQAVPTARLLVAGREGNATAALRQRIADGGFDGSVRLLGQRDDVAEILCAADVFVAPSRAEGFPGSILEAMAMEVPVVATDLPAMREVAGDTDCLRLVAPGSPSALAGAVATMLVQPEARATLARAGRARFLEAFTIERSAERMLQLYEDVRREHDVRTGRRLRRRVLHARG